MSIPGSIVKPTKSPFAVRRTIRRAAGIILLLTIAVSGVAISQMGTGRDPNIVEEVFGQLNSSTPIAGRGFELLEYRITLPPDKGGQTLAFKAQETPLEFGPGGTVCIAYDPASPANTTFCSIARQWAPGPPLFIAFAGFVFSLMVMAYAELKFRSDTIGSSG